MTTEQPTPKPEPLQSLATHRFTVLDETPHLLILARNRRGRITFFNKGCQEVTGYTSEELVRKSFISHLQPKTHHKALREEFRNLVEGGGSLRSVSDILTKSKERRVIEWVHMPFNDSSGTVQEIISIGRDITVQRQEVAALQMSKETLHRVLERLPDSITITDLKGEIQYINHPHPGRTQKEMLRKELADFSPQESRPALRRSLDSVLQTGEAQSERTLIDNRWYSTRRFPIRNNGRIIGVLTVSEDITAQQEAEDAIRLSEATYRGLIENSPSGIIITAGLPSRLVYGNPAFTQITGWTFEELSRLPPGALAAFVHPKDREETREKFWKHAAGRAPPTRSEVRFPHKDGTMRWVEVTAAAIEYKGETAQLVSFQDITDRKHAEQALKESEAKYRALVDQSQLGIIIIQGVPSRITFANPAMLPITGYSAEEIVLAESDFLRTLSHPDDLKQFVDTAPRGPPRVEMRVFHKDGTIRWVDAYGKLIEYQGLPGMLITFNDITERKQAEEARRELEEKWRSISEHSPDYILLLDEELRILFLNRKVTEQPIEEVIGTTLPSHLPPEFRKAATRCCRRVWETGEPGRFYSELQRSEDDIRHYESRVGPITKEGKVVSLLVNSTDITELKTSDLALRESEARWRSLVEQSPDTIVLLDRENKILFVNRSMHGRRTEEIIGKEPADFIFPEHLAEQKAALELAFEVGRQSSYESAGPRPDGTIAWYHIHIGPVIQDGKVVAAILSVRDITSQKMILEARRQTEENNQAIVDHTLQGIAILQGEPGKTRLVFANPVMTKIMGYTQDDLLKLDFVGISALVFEEDRIRFAQAFWDYVQSEGKGEPPRCVVRAIHKDGSLVWTDVTGTPFEYGGETSWMVTFVDISDQKEAEVALEARETQLKVLAENVPGIVYRLHINENGIRREFVNDKCTSITGFKEEELEGGLCCLGRMIHPEDRAQVLTEIKNTLENGAGFDLQYRIIHKDGSTRNVQEIGQAVKDTSGTPCFLDGVILDKTMAQHDDEIS